MQNDRSEQKNQDNRQPLVIPIERLSATALDQLIEEFVTRGGTDYGETECPLPKKKQAVHAQLLSGEVVIVFDPETSTSDIVTRRSLPAEHQETGHRSPNPSRMGA